MIPFKKRRKKIIGSNYVHLRLIQLLSETFDTVINFYLRNNRSDSS